MENEIEMLKIIVYNNEHIILINACTVETRFLHILAIWIPRYFEYQNFSCFVLNACNTGIFSP